MPFPLPAVSQAVRPTVYGYPMRQPSESEMAFFERSGVPGYAAEDMAVVLNPNSRLSPDERAAVAQNEASRLWMRETGFKPSFQPSAEQVAQFAGTAYEKNPNAMLETLLARLLSGDPSAGVPSQAMQVDADTVKRGLDKYLSAASRNDDPEWYQKAVEYAQQPWKPRSLSGAEEAQFQDWIAGTKLFNNLRGIFEKEAGEKLSNRQVLKAMDDQKDYDYREAWKSGIKEEISPHDGFPHWPSRSREGKMLKSPQHPTSWMEFFMQEVGKDPYEYGLDTLDKARAWSKSQ